MKYEFDRDTGGGRCAVCRARILRSLYLVKADGRDGYAHYVCYRRIAEAGPAGLEVNGVKLVAVEHWTPPAVAGE